MSFDEVHSKNARTLKNIQVELSALKDAAKTLKEKNRELQSLMAKNANMIKEKETELQKLESKGGLIVTEHAYLRFFERVMGFDLGQIDQRLFNANIPRIVNTLGNGTYSVSGDFRVKVIDSKVVTILTNE